MTKAIWFDDSPDEGPDCICSWCGEPIFELAIRLFDVDKEARFHLSPCYFDFQEAEEVEWHYDEDNEDEVVHDEAEEIDFGPCCACEREDGVRNILCLHFRAPVPGTGWGCLKCDLPMDGAVAVVCDSCLEDPGMILKWVVRGKMVEKQRCLFTELNPEPFTHRVERHPELTGHSFSPN